MRIQMKQNIKKFTEKVCELGSPKTGIPNFGSSRSGSLKKSSPYFGSPILFNFLLFFIDHLNTKFA